MKLIHRIGFYMGGFSIGLVFVIFFLSGKKTSCAYGPDARVLKNISTKTLIYSPTATDQMQALPVDSLLVTYILQNGDVIFNESNTQLDSCRVYAIKGKSHSLTVKNCSKEATLLSVKAHD